MSNNSLDSLWGNELKQLKYKKIKVNHFEKKIKDHLLIIDYVKFGNLLMFRLLGINAFNNTKCLKQIDINNWFSLTQFSFINMINEIESDFKTLINRHNTK